MENTVAAADPHAIQPLVSVLLPVYNAGAYLAEAIESILSQTYRNFELIIINDGSTDDSATIIDRYNDPRILSIQQLNQGLAATLNRAINIASGIYLARQDADDFSYATRLEKQVKFLESNPDYGLVGTWSEIFEEYSKTEREHRHPTENISLCFNLLFDCYFVHSSVMLRKSVFDTVGLYSVEQSRQPEDFELWSRVLKNGSFKFANLPEILVCYREVPQSLCRSNAIPFLENIVTFCSENLAWAADVSETDPTVTDIAALIHNVPRRLSCNPELEAMQEYLCRAVRKQQGTSVFDERELLDQFRNRIQTVRKSYFAFRYGPLWGKIIGFMADFIHWKTDHCDSHGSTLKLGIEREFRYEEMLELSSSHTGNAVRIGCSDGQSTIDVVIPVYNGERYIVQALSSVVTQTYRPERIIVVDDGSTDGTENLVRSFKSDIRIDYIRKPNSGLSSARNAGIRCSSSSYVAFLDADDEWFPEKLEEQLKVFRDSTMRNLSVVYCGYCIIDDNGNLSDNYFVLNIDPSIRGNVFGSLLSANRISGSGSAVLVKRECFARAGLFDERLGAFEDWDMWLRLAECFDYDFVTMNLVKIRRHQCNLQNNRLFMFENQLKFYDKWLAVLPENSVCFAGWRRLCISQLVVNVTCGAYYEAFRAILGTENRRKLFRIAFGSISLYVLFTLPKILLGMLKYNLSEKYSAK